MPGLWLGVSLFCIFYTQSIRIELNLPPKHPIHLSLSFYCTAIALVQASDTSCLNSLPSNWFPCSHSCSITNHFSHRTYRCVFTLLSHQSAYTLWAAFPGPCMIWPHLSLHPHLMSDSPHLVLLSISSSLWGPCLCAFRTMAVFHGVFARLPLEYLQVSI